MLITPIIPVVFYHFYNVPAAPPSIFTDVPVTNDAASETRNVITFAASSVLPMRPRGICRSCREKLQEAFSSPEAKLAEEDGANFFHYFRKATDDYDYRLTYKSAQRCFRRYERHLDWFFLPSCPSST
jgi:hypothetical protein